MVKKKSTGPSLEALEAKKKELQAQAAAKKAEQAALLQNRSNPSSPHPDELNALFSKLKQEIHDIEHIFIVEIDDAIASVRAAVSEAEDDGSKDV